MVSIFISASAYDFEVEGIAYNKLSEDECEVTRGDIYGHYSGNFIIPEKVTYNGISYKVTSIGSRAFEGCSDLTSVTIPNSVTSIGVSAFDYCTALTSVIIPNSVTSIGEYAFENCHRLTSVTIPNSITSIVDDAFFCCYSLASVTIPNSVTSIGKSAFSYCGLTSVTIPNSVTSIGESAFSNCDNLSSMTIGTGVLVIDRGQSTPKKVIWLTNTPPEGYTNMSGEINYVANDLYSSFENKKVYKFLSSMFEVGGIKYVPISPSDRTCDAIDCLYDQKYDVVINKTVEYKGVKMNVQNINDYLCYGNDSIESIKIEYPNNIGVYAFYGCTSAKSISVNADDICSNAFRYCTSAKSVSIDASNIDYSAFYDCISAKFAEINANSIGEYSFYNCKSLESVKLGEKLKSISSYAFMKSSSLKGITIPNSVENIGEYCFSGCSNLQSAQLSSGIKSISEYLFENCTSLTDIEIPCNINSVGIYAFSGCSSLKNVNIQDRDTELTLGSNGSSPLFNDCPLKSVYIGGNISDSSSPFYRNSSLETVIIADKKTVISDNEFIGCTSLKSIKMGDGVETIGKWAFSGCSSLENLSFGSGMKTIGEEAFSDCTNVTEISTSATVPPTCGNQALDDINKWTCNLYVPDASIEAYKAADQWKEFFFIGDAEQIDVDDNAIPCDVYNLSGIKVYENVLKSEAEKTLDNGVYIFKYENGKVEKIYVK